MGSGATPVVERKGLRLLRRFCPEKAAPMAAQMQLAAVVPVEDRYLPPWPDRIDCGRYLPLN